MPGLSLDEARRLRRGTYDPAARTLRYRDSAGDQATVILDVDVHEALVEHLVATQTRAGQHDLIFINNRGTAPAAARVIKAVFRDGFKAAGIDPLTRIHNLRHTYATTLIEGWQDADTGVSISVDDSVIAYRMSHANASFTRTVLPVLIRARG